MCWCNLKAVCHILHHCLHIRWYLVFFCFFCFLFFLLFVCFILFVYVFHLNQNRTGDEGRKTRQRTFTKEPIASETRLASTIVGTLCVGAFCICVTAVGASHTFIDIYSFICFLLFFFRFFLCFFFCFFFRGSGLFVVLFVCLFVCLFLGGWFENNYNWVLKEAINKKE